MRQLHLRSEIIKVPCPSCGATSGAQCIGTKPLWGESEDYPIRLFHMDRVEKEYVDNILDTSKVL